MNIDIKLHKEDLPDHLALGDNIAIDCEFTGLNVERDNLCLVQISTGNNDAHIIKLNRETYRAPNLKKLLQNSDVKINDKALMNALANENVRQAREDVKKSSQ